MGKYISTNSNIKLVVIDDLANRKHYCDLLIDQSFLREKGDYFPLMEKDAQIFCGSQYAMLREEFSKARAISLKKREKFELKRILINFGGTDPNNVTLSLVKKLSEMPEAKYKFSILVGINYKEKKALDNSVNSLPNFKVVTNPKSVSNLLLNTDLVIGAGGTSAWERCCLGIPSFLLKIADNQTFILEKFNEYELAFVPPVSNTIENNLNLIYEELMSPNLNKIRDMGLRSSKLVDGNGATRVLEKIMD